MFESFPQPSAVRYLQRPIRHLCQDACWEWCQQQKLYAVRLPTPGELPGPPTFEINWVAGSFELVFKQLQADTRAE